MLKRAFVDALPALEAMVKGATKVFEIFTKIMNRIMDLGGKGGTLVKAVTAILAIYASLTIFSRFFKVFGSMFGKDMSVRANNVYVNGAPVGGGVIPGSGGTPTNFPGGAGYRGTRYQRMQSSFRSGYGKLKASPILPALISAGGAYTMANAGDTSTAGGALKQGAGIAMTGFGLASMMGLGGGKISATGGGGILGKGGSLGKLGSAGGKLGVKGLGGLALIAGGSYAAGNYIGSKFKNDSFSSKAMGAGGSALAGAAIGAAVGSVIPVIGTAVGAGLGALVGGVKGWMASGAAQREAKLMGQQLVDGFNSSMNDAFNAGDIEGLAQARADAIAQHEANMKTVTHMEEYNKHVAKFEAQLTRFDKQVNIYTANAGLAERMMGMGTDAMNKLANEAGINLRSKVLSFRDVLMMSGRNMTQLAGIVKAKWGELTGLITTGAMSRIEKARQEREAVAGMNPSLAVILRLNKSTTLSNSRCCVEPLNMVRLVVLLPRLPQSVKTLRWA
jgi:hypothetical protein